MGRNIHQTVAQSVPEGGLLQQSGEIGDSHEILQRPDAAPFIECVHIAHDNGVHREHEEEYQLGQQKKIRPQIASSSAPQDSG
ncbi:hypothetical protein D3C75_948850 [compost metagenome]